MYLYIYHTCRFPATSDCILWQIIWFSSASSLDIIKNELDWQLLWLDLAYFDCSKIWFVRVQIHPVVREIRFITHKALNTGWWEIDIHSCFSLVYVVFALIHTCKNNQWLCCHNDASTLCPANVTGWHHNAKSENTVLAENGEMNNQWLI